MEEGRATEEAGPFGSRILGAGIGLGAFAFLVMVPFMIPVAFYVIANGYALIKGTTFSAETTNVGVLLTLLVLSVGTFPVLLSVLIGLFGRSLSPTRRRT